MSSQQQLRPQRRNPNSNLAIIATLADTSWRIALPTLTLAGLGITGDLKLATRPWLTIAGTVLGFGLAALLVRQQLRSLE
jgi:F0F1-type ATP synthase assembly protein I